MEASTAIARVLRFGVFELDTQSGELRRHGLKIRLPDQSFQILLRLLDRPGEVVTREELRQRLWTSDTFVDFDVGVNSAIRKLREALDDSAENPRFIETLPRRGYRFIAPAQSATTEEIPEPAAGGPTTGARVGPRWIAGGLLLAVMIAPLVLLYERGWWQRVRAGRAVEAIGSLAVLPFENLTGDAAQDYFVDGITGALTTDLAQIDGLRVISRTSARQYKQSPKRLPAIADELKVDAVLEGSVLRSGQKVRVTAQLIHAITDRHLWARSYDGDLTDVPRLQQRIAREIAAAIGRRFVPPTAGVHEPRAANPEAYDAYLKGVFAMGRGSYEGFRSAVAYFEEAIARQPDFAVAYGAMAQAQHQFLFTGPLSPRETMPKAEAAARKALELDDTVAQAHQTLAGILQHFHWQWEAGDKEFERARELRVAFGENRSAGVPSLIRSGRIEEAIAASESARNNDPLSFGAHMDVATAYRAKGQFDKAVAGIRRGLEIAPGQPRGHFQLGVTFLFMDRLNEAIGELETAVKLSHCNLRFQAYLGYAYATAGRRADARRILKELQSRAREQYVSSFGMALVHDALGEKEPALAALERAYEDRAVEFAQMYQYPPFTTIASEPRFQATMRQVGLPR